MQPLVEHRETFGGYATRVLELEGEGPPLVFFHGFGDSADTWRLVLAELARRDRRAVAVDLPGFARADRLRRDEPLLDQLDAFAAGVLDAYGPAVAVGNSLGGCVCIRAGQRAGELGLLGIVPIGPAGLGLAPWLDLIEGNPVVQTLLLAAVLPRPVVQAFVARAYRMLAFAPRATVDPLVLRTFASHFSDARTVRRYLHVARALIGELRDPFELERVRVPTLLVWGRHDAMVPHAGSRKLLDAVPGSRLELLDECGHCPQVEDPKRLVELVEGFCAEVAGTGAFTRSRW
jgi:pimeloyl-ACP methyl ester carboxylesterase